MLPPLGILKFGSFSRQQLHEQDLSFSRINFLTHAYVQIRDKNIHGPLLHSFQMPVFSLLRMF